MVRSVKLAGRALSLAGGMLVIKGAMGTVVAQCTDAGLIVPVIAVTGLAVFDIATAPASVRRYNRGPVAVAPYVNRRDRSYGVSVSLSYGRSRPVLLGPVPRLRTWPADSVRRQKSPGVALGLSLGSTVVPMVAGVGLNNGGGAALFLAGAIVGPSVGHFYAGQVLRGLGTMALRGTATLIWVNTLVKCID
jgi:hypothetical protein